MIEHINPQLCDGCNVCVMSCPTNVIRMVEAGQPWDDQTWKAVIAHPNDCHNCRLCAIDCHVDAITVTHGISMPEPLFAYARDPLTAARP